MPTAVIALKLTAGIPACHADYIGVDSGTLALIKQGIPVKLAIGDFDSVDAQEMKLIEDHSEEIIRLNPIKNDTDSEAAMHAAFERGYDHIIFLGALGGRADHAIVNLRLAYQHPLAISLLDDDNLITAFAEGTYVIKKENYTYISFFTEDEAEISLQNFKYSLDHCVINSRDLYTVSNELTEDTGILSVHRGIVLMVQAKDHK